MEWYRRNALDRTLNQGSVVRYHEAGRLAVVKMDAERSAQGTSRRTAKEIPNSRPSKIRTARYEARLSATEPLQAP